MVGTPRHAFGFREAALGSLTQVLKKQSRGNCDGRDRSICGIREPVAALSVRNDTERRAPFVGSQRQQTFLAQLPALEEVTSGLAKDLLIQARNSLPMSGAIGTAPLLSPLETPSAPIVATPQTESAKQADQTIIRDKKSRRPHQKYVRVKRKQMREASTVAVGHNAYAEPAGQRNY